MDTKTSAMSAPTTQSSLRFGTWARTQPQRILAPPLSDVGWYLLLLLLPPFFYFDASGGIHTQGRDGINLLFELSC